MKKFLALVCCALIMVGCGFRNTPKKTVDELFKKYQSLDEAVISDLELVSEGSTLTNSDQRDDYMKAMKMQYSDLKYEIIDEVVNGDEATVTVNISVYDFYKAQKDADNYLLTHQSEFETDDVYDSIKFTAYKIKQMLESSERVDYTIKVYLDKEDEKWIVRAFDKTTLEKIHGTYNYENE